MSLQLPGVVETYFKISNGGDVSGLASCFSTNATVFDESKTHEGLRAIEVWTTEARRAFIYHVQPLQALHEEDSLIVTARLAGNFPGSPVELEHTFTLAGNRICHLEIRPC